MQGELSAIQEWTEEEPEEEKEATPGERRPAAA